MSAETLFADRGKGREETSFRVTVSVEERTRQLGRRRGGKATASVDGGETQEEARTAFGGTVIGLVEG